MRKKPELAGLGEKRDLEWVNAHRNVSASVEEIRRPLLDRSAGRPPWISGLEGLRQIIRECEGRKKKVRAFGSSWSLSEMPVCQDTMIDTTGLNSWEIGLPPNRVLPKASRQNLVFAQCGTTIAVLNDALEANGLALPTSGSSNGQTICGAVSTGTHGAAIEFGSTQDFVVGIHLIAGQCGEYWLERRSDPIVSQEFCDELRATLIRDDGVFNAAVVGLGSFGVVHALLLRVDPLYYLERHRQPCSWNDVRRCIETLDVCSLGLPRDPDHLEITMSPYEIKSEGAALSVTAMYKRSSPPQGVSPVKSGSTDLFSGPIFEILSNLSDDLCEKFIVWAVNGAIRLQAGEMHDYGTPGNMFGPLLFEALRHMLSFEIGVRLKDVFKALDVFVSAAKKRPFPGAIDLRFVHRSPALLPLAVFGDEGRSRFDSTCAIEVTGLTCNRTRQFYDQVWADVEAAGIPHTFHFGKCNNLDADKVRRLWGSKPVKRWIEARHRILTTAEGRQRFSNQMLVDCGLAD
jgi:hypothetical protein